MLFDVIIVIRYSDSLCLSCKKVPLNLSASCIQSDIHSGYSMEQTSQPFTIIARTRTEWILADGTFRL